MSYTNGNLPSLGTYVGNELRVGKVFAGGLYNQAINYNANPPAYNNNNSPYGYSNGAPGAEISPFYTYAIQPLAASDTLIVNAQNLGPGYLAFDSGTGTKILVNNQTAIRFDCPRNVKLSRSGTTGAPNGYIWGYDYGGVPMFEQIIFNSNATTAYGKKAFAVVTYVYVDIHDTAWSVGSGVTLGIPFYINDFGFIGGMFRWNQSIYYEDTIGFIAYGDRTPATATTGDVRGTINLAPPNVSPLTPPNGVLYLVLNIYVQGADKNNTDETLLYGVPQYTQNLMAQS